MGEGVAGIDRDRLVGRSERRLLVLLDEQDLRQFEMRGGPERRERDRALRLVARAGEPRLLAQGLGQQQMRIGLLPAPR